MGKLYAALALCFVMVFAMLGYFIVASNQLCTQACMESPSSFSMAGCKCMKRGYNLSFSAISGEREYEIPIELCLERMDSFLTNRSI